MDSEQMRSSDRVYMELAIQISGTDALGQAFLEDTETLVLSRRGAKITSRHKLAPNQEVNIRCLGTGKESGARVVGQIGGDPGEYFYGIALLDPHVDLWDIEFPPPDKSDETVGRVLLECLRCKAQEVTHLDVFAMEVLLAHDRLSQHCKRCGDSTLWGRALYQAPPQSPPPPAPTVKTAPPPVPTRSKNLRKHTRVPLKIRACIRHAEQGDEIAVTENFSPGGFRFKSRKHYRVGETVQTALPYAADLANIFIPSRIAYVEKQDAEEMAAYGVCYLFVRPRK